ncbi:glycosyltransferase family 1 protein [Marinobacter halodurans]|uniref:Glycosyltransferase family 1 protein n=1 Tax=Marinobacter halodurans TaxID=2528979 RepID=A0ABY1ZIL0_9GAMM|nr:glycosyltransferase family 4 protein [Marinobacter halodurans]TBW51551.1 glycosyltransferase family 1 protein [Marinobacter halodurans]
MTFLVAGDPDQCTGGYGYVRSIVDGLRRRGLTVQLIGLDGAFPEGDAAARHAMDETLDALADGARVVIDGLALCGLPPLAQRHLDRLEVMALVHHPLADETGLDEAEQRHYFQTEKAALAAVGRVIVTSPYTAGRLEAYDVRASRIEVVIPGVTVPATVAPESPLAAGDPFRLLCVATLGPRKGQDLLVRALAQCADLDWQCSLAGSLDRHPSYVETLYRQIQEAGLEDRVHCVGELDDSGLDRAYRSADIFVLPSWYEGYGMVITEAMAYGLPVITTTGGALAHTASSDAAIKVTPGDVVALTAALRQLMTMPGRLQQLLAGAASERRALPSWDDAAATFRSAVANLLEQPPHMHPE